jgi:uncharacterized protein (TIGR03435 family)
MTRTLCTVAVLATLSAGALIAQAPGPLRQFDVASVKPNRSADREMRFGTRPGGRFVATNIALAQLIRAAFTLQTYQLVNAPAWVGSDRFDISAIGAADLDAPVVWKPGTPFTPLQQMLQSLLADRFGFVAHRENRESQVYALVLDGAGGGTGKLAPAVTPCAPPCGMRTGAGTVSAHDVPLPQLAELLSQVTGRLVTDATGLSGRFDFELRWRPDSAPEQAPDAPSLFTAIREQLGLRLESRRAPVPVLVVDAIHEPAPD